MSEDQEEGLTRPGRYVVLEIAGGKQEDMRERALTLINGVATTRVVHKVERLPLSDKAVYEIFGGDDLGTKVQTVRERGVSKLHTVSHVRDLPGEVGVVLESTQAIAIRQAVEELGRYLSAVRHPIHVRHVMFSWIPQQLEPADPGRLSYVDNADPGGTMGGPGLRIVIAPCDRNRLRRVIEKRPLLYLA